MSESLVGLMVAAMRQNSGRSLYGFAPLPPAPGGENWPGGTRAAIVIVVSFNTSDARLSHEDANAGTANRHTKIHKAHGTILFVMWGLQVIVSIHRPTDCILGMLYWLDWSHAVQRTEI